MLLYIQHHLAATINYAHYLRLSSQKMSASKTAKAVEKQGRAMMASAFEVGLFDPNAAQGAMLPRVWDLETLLRSVSWLRLKNLEGRNIYIRPCGEHALSLIDDVSLQAIERLKSEGFAPSVILETSPRNFQTWLCHGQILPKHLSTFAARLLASRFGGDPASADWRHYGRLAGFTNRKEKYRKADGTFPYVRLHEAKGMVYAKANEFLAEIKMLCETERSELPHPSSLRHRRLCNSNLKSIQDFRAKPRYCGDQTRVDLAYAIYALAHGISENDTRNALGSRDLTHKGDRKRQQEYIDRTIKKARERIEAN
jgi:RepB DNA-primase from phage plasmid